MAQRWRRGRSALLLGTALQAGVVASWSYPARSQPAPNARPTGGAVSAGSASISYSPTATTIDQSSQRAAINWRSFNVGAQQSVNFVQPSASATALNRVKSPNPSQIAGKIDANGQVVLINQSGVIFYKGAQVNTAGLIVSAAGMSNANFMAGKMVFDKAARPNAAIVNQGTLTVKQAGLAALVAPRVANSGVIEAKLGHVVLAGARTATLDLYGDGLVSLDVSNQVTQAPLGGDGKPVSALVTNTGVIRADGGTVQLTAREASGLVHNLVEAGGTITAPSVGARTGTIVLDGVGGSVVLTGAALAQGNAPGTVGGSVQIDSSADVTLASGSRVRVSGRAGGGTVAIGTTLARAKGGPGTVSALTAQNVTVAQGARVTANARANGNGGRVALLSGQSTNMAGTITAKGGPQGGDGGFVEVSGGVLALSGHVDASAPNGAIGTLLLDPSDLWVSDVEPSVATYSVVSTDLPTIGAGQAPNATTVSWVSPALLAQQNANISLAATDNLFVATSSISGVPTANTLNLGAHTLSLTAGTNLTIDRGFTIDAGGISLTATTGSITLGGSSGVTGGLITQQELNALGPTSLQVVNGSPTGANDTNVTMSAGSGITLVDSILGSASSPIGTLDFSTTASGGVTQATQGAIFADTLESSGGVVGAVSLTGSGNSISNLVNVTASSITLTDSSNLSVFGTLKATSGDITIVDNAATIELNGTQSANNIFYENTATGGAIVLGFGEGSVALTAATGGRISLVADNLTEDFAANTVSAPSGTIEIAPFTQGTSITLGGTGGLSLPQSILSSMTTETLRIGEATINGSPTITAGSIVVSGTAGIDLSPTGTTTIATTLELHAAAVNGATGGITVDDPVTGADNVYLQSDGPGGITVGSSIAALDVLGLQTDAFNMTTGGTISTGVFELAPNTQGTGMTLGASGAGLSLPSLTGISADEVRIGAVTEPGNTSPTTTAGSVNITDNFGGNIEIEIDTTGNVTVAPGATLTAFDLVFNATGNVTEATNASVLADFVTGTAASFSLPSSTNGIGEIDTLTATSGDIAVVDNPTLAPASDPTTLALTGTHSARNIFYEVVDPGGTLALGLFLGEGGGPPVTLTAATGGRISLVADNISTVTGDTLSTINAPGGRVELAPFSAINTSLLGSTGLVISPQLLSFITPTGTLVVGGFTNAPVGGVTPTPSASSVTIDSPINLTGTATTLDLLATGAVSEPSGPVTVNTLIGDAGSATLSNPGTPSAAANNNDINTLGSFTTTTGGFMLADNGNPGTLSVTGPVSAATNVALSDGTTGGVSASGAIAAGTTLSIVTGSGGIALVNGGSLTGTTVDLSSTGGLSEVAGATITAGTLQSTGGISGGAATLAGASNAIAALGNFAVSGGTFSLSDTGALAVDGAVSASSVTIGGNAGSTPSGITLLSGGSVAAPTVALSAGASGIALDSGAVLGETGASIDLGSTGGISENAGATIIAATLASLNSVTGGAVTLAGATNAIGDLGSFTVLGNGFSLSDQGSLDISGPLSASTVTIGGAAGSTPSGITLLGAGSVVAPAIALSAGSGGVTLDSGAVLGETGANIDLASAGGISENAGATITAATLASAGSITGGPVTLAGTGNMIGDLGSFTVAGNGFTLSDQGSLDISGPLSASSVTIGGAAGSTPSSMTLLSTGDVAAPAIALNAGSGGIALVSGAVLGENGANIDLESAGGISEDAGGMITAAKVTSPGSITGGAVTLAGTGNTIGDLGSFTVAGNGFTLSDQGSLDISGPLSASSVTIGGNAGSTPTGITLTGTGSIAAPSVTLTAGGSGISISDGASLGQAGAIVGLTSTGAVTETNGGAVDAGTLSVTASTVSLPGVSNAVSALGNSTATSFSLDDSTDLLIAATLNAADISLIAPNNQISLGNGATIITGGVTPSIPGPINPSEEPSNGAPGAFIEAARFTQIGSSTLAGQGGGSATLELTVSTSASFDPPLGLIAPNGWLILNLGNGTATGDVFVNALNVTHTVPGGATLDGTIDGVPGPGDSILGADQPTIDPAYTFNGCEIGAGCPPPTQLIVASTPPPPTQLIVATGPLYPALQDPLPPLATLTPLVLLAYPLWPAGGEALTDPDVVPPNVSYVDY